MQLRNHKIGEKLIFLSQITGATKLRVLRTSDGKFFNFSSKKFEIYAPELATQYVKGFEALPNTSLKRVILDSFPAIPLDLVFETLGTSQSPALPLSYERHLFGGAFWPEDKNALCVVFGTVYDLSRNPLRNVRVEVSLNRGGYFINRHPAMSLTAFALTDEAGYFEIALIQGLDVTVTIPEIGSVCSGIVPAQPAVEFSPYCLLKK